MDFLTNLMATLRGEKHEKIPFAPYYELFPRGEFCRKLRNRGLGLLLRKYPYIESKYNIRTEEYYEGNKKIFLYKTPKGTLSRRLRINVGRISDSQTVRETWLIKGKEDIDAAISMIDDSVFEADRSVYENTARDLGNDGIVRIRGGVPPFEESIEYFGLENWSYAIVDYPEDFKRFTDALLRRFHKMLPIILDSPGEFYGLGSVSDEIGPRRFKDHILPFYKEYIPEFSKRGKICAIHAHNNDLRSFADLLAETEAGVIEAYTPPPISNLPIQDARKAWGTNRVIWINFPETIFWDGPEATKRYTLDLFESDPNPERLVMGFTEMGMYGVINDESEYYFKSGISAIMDAIDEFSGNSSFA